MVLLIVHPFPHSTTARPKAQILATIPFAETFALRKLILPLSVSEFYDIWTINPHLDLDRNLGPTLVHAAFEGSFKKSVGSSLGVLRRYSFRMYLILLDISWQYKSNRAVGVCGANCGGVTRRRSFPLFAPLGPAK
jgi:hypothetical protein